MQLSYLRNLVPMPPGRLPLKAFLGMSGGLYIPESWIIDLTFNLLEKAELLVQLHLDFKDTCKHVRVY